MISKVLISVRLQVSCVEKEVSSLSQSVELVQSLKLHGVIRPHRRFQLRPIQ